MLIRKKHYIFFILLLISFIYILNIIIDFSRLSANASLYASVPNEVLKRFIVLLAAALVLMADENSLNPRDNTFMKLVFLFIVIGELCFMSYNPDMAIVFFAACQCLLILRHSRNLIYKLITASLKQKLILSAAPFGIAFFVMMGFAALLPFVASYQLKILGVSYGILLSISLWSGLAAYILGTFPPINSKMIVLGMICFFCCDFFVGLDGILKSGVPWIIASSLIWVFYTPAVTLLALSSYSYSKRVEMASKLKKAIT